MDEDDHSRGRGQVDEEEMLPRGGKQLRKQREQDPDDEDVFAMSDDADGGASAAAPGADEGSNKKIKARRLRVLSRGTVQVGSLLLGVVSGVFETGLKLDLPHGMQGYVSSLQVSAEHTARLQNEEDEDSPDLETMFHVGDLVAASVVGYRQHMLNMTLEPDVVAQYLTTESAPALAPGLFVLGVVQSVEDNGWLVKLCGSGKTGFCPKNAAPSAHWGVPGRPVLVTVVQVSDRLIEVSGKVPGKLATSATALQRLGNGSAILPGMYLTQPTMASTEDGWVCDLLGQGELKWTAHLHWSHAVPEKKGATMRILWVDPDNRAVGLTGLPHLTTATAAVPKDVRKAATAFASSGDASVVHVDPGAGVWLQSQAGLRLFAPQGLCEPAASYHVGQQHVTYRAVCAHIQLMERTLRVGLNKQVLAAKWATAESIPLGTVLESVVVTHVDKKTGTLQMRLDGLVEGFVPQHAGEGWGVALVLQLVR